MKKILIGAVLMLAPMAVSCDNQDKSSDKPSEYTPIDLPGNTRAGVQKSNDLAFELIGSLKEFSDANDENSVVSPFSFFSIVTMFASADPAALAPALGIGSSEEEMESMRKYVAILNEMLPKVDSSTEFLTANAVFISGQKTLDPEFVATTQSMMPFESFITVDGGGFNDMIKNWLSEQSKGNFKSGIQNPTNPCFVNTLYFKGYWTSPFDPAKTSIAPFNSISGNSSDVEFMKQSTTLKYAESHGWQAVELPYGNENFSMFAILPDGKDRSENILTSELWASLEGKYLPYAVTLEFPKFRVESEINLFNYLREKCGIEESLDVAGVYSDALFPIYNVSQSSKVAVDEESTEVASFTVVNSTTAPGPCGAVDLKFNRPFYFVIKENSTGTILSIGRINSL